MPAIQGELNPAAWMLEITTPGMEHQLAVDFAQVYKESDLARCAPDLVFLHNFGHYDCRSGQNCMLYSASLVQFCHGLTAACCLESSLGFDLFLVPLCSRLTGNRSSAASVLWPCFGLSVLGSAEAFPPCLLLLLARGLSSSFARPQTL